MKIDYRLLPIKMHFLFFMAAMGPILPQLSVLGKQLGVAPDVMGYITSILPIMYVLAKPLFGYLADYFTNLRKMIFIILIMGMTLSYAGFYFLPNNVNSSLILDNLQIPFCQSEKQLYREFCVIKRAQCSIVSDQLNNTTYRLNFIDKTYPDQENNTHLKDLKSISLKLLMATLDLCLIDDMNSINFLHEIKTLKEQHLINTIECNVTEMKESSSIPECNIDDDDGRKNTTTIYKTKTFWLFVTLFCLGTIGFNVTNSISDAICFDILIDLKAEESKYGAQRVWGTIGFGLSALISGYIVDYWTTTDNVVKSFTPAIIVMLIFSGLDLIIVSKLQMPKLSSSESIVRDVWQLVQRPYIVVFLIFATIAGIIDSFIIYFMFWHVEKVAEETNYLEQIKLIEGCVVAAECLAGEVPFFFYSGKIIKKLGYVHCMSLCFFCYSVRLILIAWIPNPWYLVLVELFFQGCTYALCYTCIVAYASSVAPPGTTATVQGLMAGMDDGLGFSIGSLIGGLIFKNYGGRFGFVCFSILAFITCLAHIIIRPFSDRTIAKYHVKDRGDYQIPIEQIDSINGTNKLQNTQLI